VSEYEHQIGYPTHAPGTLSQQDCGRTSRHGSASRIAWETAATAASRLIDLAHRQSNQTGPGVRAQGSSPVTRVACRSTQSELSVAKHVAGHSQNLGKSPSHEPLRPQPVEHLRISAGGDRRSILTARGIIDRWRLHGRVHAWWRPPAPARDSVVTWSDLSTRSSDIGYRSRRRRGRHHGTPRETTARPRGSSVRHGRAP